MSHSTTLVGAIVGVGLFLIFERKRIAQWRARSRQRKVPSEGTPPSPAPSATAPALGEALAVALGTAGFFTGMPADYAGAAVVDVRQMGYSGLFRYPWRAAALYDDEENPEDTGPYFVNIASQILEGFGLPATIAYGRLAESGAYTLDIQANDKLAARSLVIISEAEARHEGHERLATMAWHYSAARVFLFFNQILESAGRRDRFYAVSGRFADSVLVLTPEMLDAVKRFGGAAPADLPFLRSSEPPNFGSAPFK